MQKSNKLDDIMRIASIKNDQNLKFVLETENTQHKNHRTLHTEKNDSALNLTHSYDDKSMKILLNLYLFYC